MRALFEATDEAAFPRFENALVERLPDGRLCA